MRVKIAPLGFVLFATAAHAANSYGPNVSFENTTAQDCFAECAATHKSRSSFEAMAPLSVGEHGRLLPYFGGTQARFETDGDSSHSTTLNPELYAFFDTSPMLGFFGSFGSFEPLAVSGSGRMAESYLGMQWRDRSPDLESDTTLAVRYRRFPYATRWLFIAGKRWFWGKQWYINLTFPSQAIVRYTMLHSQMRWLGGVEFVGRQEAYTVDDTRYWREGYATQAFAGVEFPCTANLFLRTDLGWQRETLSVYDTQGERIAESVGAFRPWARIGLVTSFEGE